MAGFSEKDKEEAKKKITRYLRATQERQLTELRGWWLAQMADPARAAREK